MQIYVTSLVSFIGMYIQKLIQVRPSLSVYLSRSSMYIPLERFLIIYFPASICWHQKSHESKAGCTPGSSCRATCSSRILSELRRSRWPRDCAHNCDADIQSCNPARHQSAPSRAFPPCFDKRLVDIAFRDPGPASFLAFFSLSE